MPFYDYACERCEHVIEDVYFPLSRFEDKEAGIEWCQNCHGYHRHEIVIRGTEVQDWGNCSEGRFFQDMSPKGEYFRDKRSYKEYMKKNGYRDKIWYC